MHTIIISSAYLSHEKELNDEVRLDAEAVKKIYSDATEIIFPIQTDSMEVFARNVQEIMLLIDNLTARNVTDVQIILNTHGVPGSNDIDNKIIIRLIKLLVNYDIQIHSLCALMCDGFTKETPTMAEQRCGYKLADRQGGISLKSSSMKILQRKLNALELKTAQNFIIRGFDKPYDPLNDSEEVIELLKGNGGKTLEVTTQKSELWSQKIRNIQTAVAYISSVNSNSETKTELKWNQSTNLLGEIFKEMLADIDNYFETVSSCALNEASQLLYTRIKDYALQKGELQEGADFSNQKAFLKHYRNWAKENPLKNFDENARLELINVYYKNLIPSPTSIVSPESLHRFFSVKNSGYYESKEFEYDLSPIAKKSP